MTDPLRPFAGLLDSITRVGRTSRSAGAASQQTTTTSHSVAQHSTPSTTVSLPERLATRLSVIGKDDRKRRRHVFVEVALLSELGDELAMDHGFGELVEEVCAIIATDKHMTDSLDTLLESL